MSLLYKCMLKLNIPENWAEKPPPSLFCLFVRDQDHTAHVEYPCPHNTNMDSDSSYPNIFFTLPILSTFQNTHI